MREQPMIKVLSFKYTKSNGKTSSRVFVPFTNPSKSYFGVDITELEPVVQADFALRLDALQKQHQEQVDTLLQEFDLKTMYRNFLQDSMEDVVVENI